MSEILRVRMSNGEVIEGTKSHPVWAMNIAAFLRLDELKIGDVLDTLGGPQEVTAINLVQSPQPVYNIEVASEHVYRIGQSGVLVHNVSDDCPLVQITTTAGKGFPVNPTVVKDNLGRVISSKAVIRPRNSHGCTLTTAAARAVTTPDDAGHIIGSFLGGKGIALSDNIFAHYSTINRGKCAKHEGWVADQVRAGKNVEVEVRLIYSGNSTKPVLIEYLTYINGLLDDFKTFGN